MSVVFHHFISVTQLLFTAAVLNICELSVVSGSLEIGWPPVKNMKDTNWLVLSESSEKAISQKATEMSGLVELWQTHLLDNWITLYSMMLHTFLEGFVWLLLHVSLHFSRAVKNCQGWLVKEKKNFFAFFKAKGTVPYRDHLLFPLLFIICFVV